MGVRRQERRKGTGAVTEVSVAVTIETGISRVMRGVLSPRKAVMQHSAKQLPRHHTATTISQGSPAHSSTCPGTGMH